MPQTPSLRFFCIINPNAGSKRLDYEDEIKKHFAHTHHHTHFYMLQKGCSVEQLKRDLEEVAPDRLIAVGGDGTVKLAAECLLHTSIPLAIVPAGSANGMAKEFNIPNDLQSALKTAQNGHIKHIHATRINGELSIHLADIGINAHIIKRFQKTNERGMKGYAKAAWQAFRTKKRIKFNIYVHGMYLKRKAEMLVIANGTMYGTGVKINRSGSLYDNKIELVLVKTLSILEIIKMRFSKSIPFDPFKTETIKIQKADIICNKNSYFQIDGEYIGKISKLRVEIIENAIQVMTNPQK